MNLPWFLKGKSGIAEHEGEVALKENPQMMDWLKAHKGLVGSFFHDAMVGTIIWVGVSPSPAALKTALVLGVIGTILTKAGLISSDAESQAKADAAALQPEVVQLASQLPAAEDVAKHILDGLKAGLAADKAAGSLTVALPGLPLVPVVALTKPSGQPNPVPATSTIGSVQG